MRLTDAEEVDLPSFMKFTTANPLADPLGPGSPAWEAFDQAVSFYIEGKKAQGGACRARMRLEVKRHGGDIESWVSSLNSRINECMEG